jgi:hypothetical protein
MWRVGGTKQNNMTYYAANHALSHSRDGGDARPDFVCFVKINFFETQPHSAVPCLASTTDTQSNTPRYGFCDCVPKSHSREHSDHVAAAPGANSGKYDQMHGGKCEVCGGNNHLEIRR